MAIGDEKLTQLEWRVLLRYRDELRKALKADGLRHLSPRVATAVSKLMGELDRVGIKVAEREIARPDDRGAFLKMKDSLLANHWGEFVAFANGEFVAARPSLEELRPCLAGLGPGVDVYIERVDDVAFLERPGIDVPDVDEAVLVRAPGEAGDEQPELVTDRESFLRMKDYLLRHYRGMFVAFAGGRVVGASKSLEELWEHLDSTQPLADVCIEPVNEEAFEKTGPIVMTGIYAAHEVT